METKYTRYFVISVVSALAAGLLFIFRQEYLESLKYVEGGLRLLLFHSYTPYAYLVPISAFIIIFGLMGSIKARIVFMGILFEFLYFLIDISIFCFYWGKPVGTIYYLSTDTPQYVFDPLIITGTILVIVSLIACYRSIGVKATRPTFSAKVPARTTAVIFILLILVIWASFNPYSLRFIFEKHEYISWGVPFNDPTLQRVTSDFILIYINRILLVGLFAVITAITFLRQKSWYPLFIALTVFYAIRWFEILPAIRFYSNGSFLEGIIFRSMTSQQEVYPFSFFFSCIQRMLDLRIPWIPGLISLVLAMVFFSHLKEENDRVIRKKVREFFKALFPYLFSKASI